jgi:hypothetical protein
MASSTAPDIAGGGIAPHQEQDRALPYNEKTDSLSDEKHLEHVSTNEGNLVYDDVDEEPELHARTYIALLSMFALNFVQVFALQGPPSVVSGL